MGYFSEFNGIGYLAPRCIVKLDEQYRYHSLTEPAIQFNKYDNSNFYYIENIHFPQKLWKDVVNKRLSAKECLAIENVDRRFIALRLLGWNKVIKELNAIKIAQDEYGELYEIDLKDDNKPAKFFKAIDPSTGEPIFERVRPECQTPKQSQMLHYRLDIIQADYSDFERT